MAQVQRETDDRTNTTTTSRRGNIQSPGLDHEIPTDQEVVGETELVDHAQFTIQTRHHLLRQHAVLAHFGVLFVAILQPFFAKLSQSIFGSHFFGQFVDREETFPKLQLDVDRIRDLLTSRTRVLQAGKIAIHLRRRP